MADRTIKYVIGADTAQFENGTRVVRKEMGEMQRSGNGLQSSLSSLKSQLGGLFAGFSIAAFIKQTLEAALAVERLQSMFKATQGSVQAAKRELEFIRGEAGRLGLVYKDAAEAYGKFMASIKGTSLEGMPGRKIFSGVSEAVAALKLDAQASARIFLQMQQMASKGKVTAEDLNVMSESLPGVKQMIADAMGTTTIEVSKMMEQGKLLAADVLPKLAEQLHKTYGTTATEAAKQGQAAINRFKNEIFETESAIGTRLLPALTKLANWGSTGLKTLRENPQGPLDHVMRLVAWSQTGKLELGAPAPLPNYDPQMARVEADRRATEAARNAERERKERAALAAGNKATHEKDPFADLSRDYASMIGKMRREIIKNDPGFDAMAEKIALARDEFDKMSARIPENQAALKQYLDTMQVELEQSIIDAQTLKDAVAETSREFQLYLQDLESQPPVSPYRNFLPDDEKERILADLREIQSATDDILNQAIDNPFDRELAQLKKYYAERNKLLQDTLKKELEHAGYNEDQKKELIELTTKKTTALKEQQGADETDLERRKLKGMMALNAQYLSYAGALLHDLASLTDGTSRDSFEAQKALAMGATVVNTASAIMQALASMPPPASYVAAAFAAATGAIQIAKIASTSYGNGGSVGGVSAGFGAGAASSGGRGSVGSGIGGPLTGIRDAQTSESLQRLAAAADNASLAIGKVADGLTSIADLFGEGTRGALLAGGLTGPAGQIPRSLLGESIKSNVLLWGRPEQVLMNQFTNMFGWGNDWYTKSTGLNLGITNGRLSGRNYADLQKDGGWFSGDDHRTDYSALNPLVRSSLEAYLGQITSTITRAAVVAGTRPNFGDVTIDPVNIQTSGRTPEDIQKDLEAWFTKTADTLAQSVNGLKEFTYYGESAFDALVRLSTALQSTNEGLELIGATLINSTLQGANAAYKLQELMGGSDQFTDKIEAYFDVMFTDAEQEAMKAAQAQRQVNTAFAEMGRTVPVTRQGFRDLVGSLDLTTDRGGALFSALMDIAPAFDLVAQAADKALEALKDTTLTSVEVSLKAANALRDIMGGGYSTLSPETLYMERQAAFAAALANGRSAEIPDLGKALLESSRQYNASGAGYVSDYEAVTRALADIAGMEGSPTLSAAEQQVQLLTDIHRALEENNYSQLTVLTAQVSMQSSLNQLLSTYLKQATPEVALSNEDAARQVLRMVVGIIPPDLRWDLDKSGSVTIVDSLMAAKGSRPSFALGSPYIPYDMTANIHAGEMVIDPTSSAVLRKYGIPGGDSTATVNEIKLTNIEIKQTNTELRALVSLQSEANRQMIDRLTATEARLANIEAKTRLEAAA